MSNDLISRKAAYKAFSDYLNKCFVGEISSQTELNIGEIVSVIKSIPVAFDKEKMIEELEKRSHNYYPSIDHYCLSHKAVNLKDAIEIVEKGGIE